MFSISNITMWYNRKTLNYEVKAQLYMFLTQILKPLILFGRIRLVSSL